MVPLPVLLLEHFHIKILVLTFAVVVFGGFRLPILDRHADRVKYKSQTSQGSRHQQAQSHPFLLLGQKNSDENPQKG